jgi:hypothetical protein
MLNWNRQEQSLTQGQTPGRQVVARAVHIDELTTQIEQVPPAGTANQSIIDPNLIARLVYELLRQDLIVEHERRQRRR